MMLIGVLLSCVKELLQGLSIKAVRNQGEGVIQCGHFSEKGFFRGRMQRAY